jgi:branched-subunit amino acid transport protein
MSHASKIYLAIFLMGVSVYMIRLLGFWLGGYIKFNKNIKMWLDYLPGCLLTAVIAPDLFSHAGYLELVAAVIVVITMIKTKNIFIAILLGMTVVSVYRFI